MSAIDNVGAKKQDTSASAAMPITSEASSSTIRPSTAISNGSARTSTAQDSLPEPPHRRSDNAGRPRSSNRAFASSSRRDRQAQLIAEAQARPPVPREQKWHRQPDWLDTKEKLRAIVLSGNFQPYILKDKIGIDGRHYQKPVSLLRVLPELQVYSNTTREDVLETGFVHQIWKQLTELAHGCLVEMARRYEEQQGHSATMVGLRGEQITLAGPNYDGTAPASPSSSASATQPAQPTHQQQQQPSVQDTQGQAAQRRSKRRRE